MEVATIMRRNIKQTDYYVLGDSDAPVDEIPHKRAWVSDLADSNEGLDGIEHINEEEDHTTDFVVETFCDA